MPVRRTRAPFRRRGKKMLRRRRLAVRRPIRYNPQPVFTETFKIPGADPLAPEYRLNSNTGGVLAVRISQMPQLAQYSALYTKYRILKAQFICLPQFLSTSSDINAASYNASLGLGNWGMARLVTSVQNSPNTPVPLSEDEVLEDNGCKIHIGKPKLTLSCRPVPDLLDANNVAITQRGQFINFNAGAPDVTHYGIRWWYTLPNPGGNITNVPYFVYVKLTFQLADPR